MIGAIAGDIIGSGDERNPIKTKDFHLFSRRSKFTEIPIRCMQKVPGRLLPDFLWKARSAIISPKVKPWIRCMGKNGFITIG